MFTPIDTTVAQGLFDITTGQATLGQLFTNAQRPVAGTRTVTDKGFQVTRLRQQPFFCQAIESGFDQLIRRSSTAQLACQLDPTMFAARKQIHSRPPHRDGVIQSNGHRQANQASASARSSAVELALTVRSEE